MATPVGVKWCSLHVSDDQCLQSSACAIGLFRRDTYWKSFVRLKSCSLCFYVAELREFFMYPGYQNFISDVTCELPDVGAGTWILCKSGVC